MIPPCPFVDIAGPPYERGFLYGQAVPHRIALSIALYSNQLIDLGYDTATDRSGI